MSIWIANKNEYGEYQFDERYLPEWYTPEYIEVGTLRYYRYIIRNKDTTFSLYTTNFTEPLSYQDSAFLKLPKFP